MASETNFGNFVVKTIQQAQRLYLKTVSDILLWPIHVKLREDTFTEDVVGVFRKKKRKMAGMIGGSAAVIAGAGVAGVGAVLMPLTLGVSVGLLASGAAIGALGATVSVGVSVESLVKDRKMKDHVEKALKQLCNLEREIVKLILIPNVAHEVFLNVIGRERSSEDDITTAESVSTFPDDTVEMFKASFDGLTKYQNALGECHTLSGLCEELSNLTESLKSTLKLIIDYPAEYIDAKAHSTIERAFINPFDYLYQIPVSPFILTSIEKAAFEKNSLLAVWLNHLDIMVERKDEGENKAKLPTNTSLNEEKVLENRTCAERVNITSFYGDENSKKFGAKLLRFVKAVSAAKLIIESSANNEDLEFLGKSNFDFFNNDSEEWPSAFESVADLMTAVNKSLNFDQHDG